MFGFGMTQFRSPSAGTSRKGQRGIALVFALLGILLLSMLAAGLVFVSSTEALASFSFKTQNQARYAALAGVQRAVDWYTRTYGPWLDPESGGFPTAVPIAVGTYDVAVRGPQFPPGSGAEVVLASAPNFPTTPPGAATIISSFNALNSSLNTIPLGNATASYTITEARLISHERFRDLTGVDDNRIIERWRISATGTVPNPLGPPTSVQETAVIQNVFMPLFSDAITGKCQIDVNGNINTDSYNSGSGPYNPATAFTGGDAGATVATGSYFDMNGKSGTINGDLKLPLAPLPDPPCPPGTNDIPSGPPTVAGDIEIAPVRPFPPIAPFPPGNITDSCSGKGANYFEEGAGATKVVGYQFDDNPQTGVPNYNRCSMAGGMLRLLHDAGGAVHKFYFHTLDITAMASVARWNKNAVPSPPGAPCNPLQVPACPQTQLFVSTSLSIGGGGVVGGDPPTAFTIFFSACQLADGTCNPSCTEVAKIAGGPAFYGSVYAPCATCDLSGTTAVYGSVMCKNVTSNGGVDVHYDLAMKNMFGWTSSFRVASQSRNVY